MHVCMYVCATSGRLDNGMPHLRVGHAFRCCGRRQRKPSQTGCSWTLATSAPTTTPIVAEVVRRPTPAVWRGVGRIRPGAKRLRGAGHRNGGDEASSFQMALLSLGPLCQYPSEPCPNAHRKEASIDSTFATMAHLSLGTVTGPPALRPVQTQPRSSHDTAGRRWCGGRRRHRSHPVLLPAVTRAAPGAAELGSSMTLVPECVPYHGAFVARTLSFWTNHTLTLALLTL